MKPLHLQLRNLVVLPIIFVFLILFSFVSQAQITPGDPSNFITEWTFPAAVTEIRFNALTAAGGAVDYIWSASPSGNSGSGTFSQTSAGAVTLSGLTIAAGDVVTLEMAPVNLRRFYIREGPDRERLSDVSQWGSVEWSSMEAAFEGSSNLIITASDIPNLSNVSSMRDMFRRAITFNQPIGDWDVSSVTDMKDMLSYATSFNQSIGDWDVSSVTTMQSMLRSATSFNQPIGEWDVSSVENMGYMLYLVSSFNHPIGDWDVSKVTSMEGMISRASSFNQPIGDWDVSKVTTMREMFKQASSFNQPIGDWDVSKVTNMDEMFNRAFDFNQPIGAWDVGNVTTMESMFIYASSFNQAIGDWDVSKVYTMSEMFYEADAFNQPIGGWDVSKVTNMSSMFYEANSFNYPLGDWDVSKVFDMTSMFFEATNFNQDISSWCVQLISSVPYDFSLESSLVSGNLPVWGTCPNSTPTVPASNILVSNEEAYRLTLTWTNGDGAGRKVFMKKDGTDSPVPVNNTDYTPSSVFGNGSQIGTTGWFAVYSGSDDPAPSITISGLDAVSDYRIKVVEFSGDATTRQYLLADASDNPVDASTTDIAYVENWTEFAFAFQDTDVKEIRFTDDIVTPPTFTLTGFSSGQGRLYFLRDITIDGQGNSLTMTKGEIVIGHQANQPDVYFKDLEVIVHDPTWRQPASAYGILVHYGRFFADNITVDLRYTGSPAAAPAGITTHFGASPGSHQQLGHTVEATIENSTIKVYSNSLNPYGFYASAGSTVTIRNTTFDISRSDTANPIQGIAIGAQNELPSALHGVSDVQFLFPTLIIEDNIGAGVTNHAALIFRKNAGADDLEAAAIIDYILANNPLLPQMGILLPALEFYPCIPMEEIDALRAIYDALDGDNWTWTDPSKSWKDAQGNWKPLTSSTYEGVQIVDCNVVGLRLSNKNLVGEIPDEIGDFSELVHLDMSNNRISGAFNPALSTLLNLEYLDLSKNAIVGDLPASLINLVSLTSLDLSYNGLQVWTSNLQQAFIPNEQDLEDFINNLQPSIGDTQISSPLDIQSGIQQPNSYLIEWQPIAYQADGGFYIIRYGKDPLTLDQNVNVPNGKSASEYLLEDLDYATDYYYAIQTYTPDHSNNQNEIYSTRSDVFTFRTGLNPIERGAIVALFEETNGKNWQNKANWLGSDSEEDGLNQFGTEFNWYGLEFGLVNGKFEVIGIDLSQNFLGGSFPESLCKFPFLKSLRMNGNNLVGEIPACLMDLPLEQLDISYNGLYTRNEDLKAFLDGLQPGWEETQTVSPVGSTAQLLNPSAIIKWTPIQYQGGTGRYFIKYRAEDEGGFTTITVEGKGSSEGLIPNLAYGKKYLVYVQSQTDANPPFNPSAVTSDLGEVIELFFATPIAATERAALIALYEAMSGDDWTSNDNWKDPVNFSASGTEFLWKGVTLSKVNNVWSVTGIDLSNNNLNGTLPDLFAAFPNLTSLNLSGNCLAGAVPASLSSLQNLQILNLSDNRFNSFTLTSLSATDVNLSYNALGGTGDNTALLAQLQADYLATQTLTPSGISATTVGDASATVSWEAIAFTAGEGHYELRLRKVGTTNWSTRATENKGQTTLQYTGLEANTSYEVQIRSVRIQRAESCFTISAWSESTTFMTLPAMPARAALSSPTDYALNTATSLNLVVKETAFAANYEIQLSTSQDFSAATTVSFTSASGEQAVDGLLNNTRYYWRARGVNGRGAGEWSAMSQFRTGLSVASATVAGQVTCASEGAQVFMWNAILGASHYRVEIASDANFNTVVKRASVQSLQLIVMDLRVNQTYYWRVQGYNDVSAYVGNWSSAGQLGVQPRIQVAGELELCSNARTTLSLETKAGTSIQWYANGTAIAGATSNSYAAISAGSYYAILTSTGNVCASHQTESVTITEAVVSVPAITASSTALCEGESTTLSTSATGNSYQWFRNGTAIAGATAQSYRTSEAGSYSVEVRANQTCSVTSKGLAINVTAVPQQQAIRVTGSLTLCGADQTTSLSLTLAQGQTIQWYRNGTLLANATGASLSATQVGTYDAIIRNGTCSIRTASVEISGTILSKPVISMSQFGQTQINLGRPVAIQSTYATTGVGYQWLYNGVPVEGANTAILLASRNGRYQMQFRSADGCTVISEEFVITYPAGKEPKDIPIRSLNPRDLMEIAKEISDGWLQAFPNPTQGMLTISVSADRLAGQESVDVRVVDFLGRGVYNGKLMLTGDRYKVNFNMANLSKGIYYIYVEDGNISHRKVVKKE